MINRKTIHRKKWKCSFRNYFFPVWQAKIWHLRVMTEYPWCALILIQTGFSYRLSLSCAIFYWTPGLNSAIAQEQWGERQQLLPSRSAQFEKNPWAPAAVNAFEFINLIELSDMKLLELCKTIFMTLIVCSLLKSTICIVWLLILMIIIVDAWNHGLRTPNKGKNQRNLKIWADVADKICFGRT